MAEPEPQTQAFGQGVMSGTGPFPEPWASFEACRFTPATAAMVNSLGFTAPSPVQSLCWPLIASKRDVVGIAQTGSGKTLAFLVPAMDGLMRSPLKGRPRGPLLLIMAPTRELSAQIKEEGDKVGAGLRLVSLAVYGGVPYREQTEPLRRGVHWVVGTPGRLRDLIGHKHLDVGSIRVLALDEADQMLDLGFEEQVREILSYVPQQRQTLMFTATWPARVQQLAADLLRAPVQVKIGASTRTVNLDIRQQFLLVQSERERLSVLIGILQGTTFERAVVFTNTKIGCSDLADVLVRKARLASVVLHGDLEQPERDANLRAFRMGSPPLLVATDVAARGLDIDGVSAVINYEVATTAEFHVHRIGRTGRAGAAGLAITILNKKEKRERELARAIAQTMEASGQEVPVELADFFGPMRDEDARSTVSKFTHNTGLTEVTVDLAGHQLARVLARDTQLVQETLKRGLRFMNIERSKAVDDRFRRPKWRTRRIVPWSELEEAAGRDEKGLAALESIRQVLGTQPEGLIHVVIHDLFEASKYVATELFELPAVAEDLFELMDMVLEGIIETDDSEFLLNAMENQQFISGLKAMFESGDTEDEFYFQTFAKLSFPMLGKLPLVHYLCELGYDECIRVLLQRFSVQTAPKPWLRLADVEWREKKFGNTPFHICAYTGAASTLRILLEHAKVHQIPVHMLRTTDGKSALEVAQERSNMQCFNLLCPFFPGAAPVQEAVDMAKKEVLLIVDAYPPAGRENGRRVSKKVPQEMTVKGLADCLRAAVAELRADPALIMIKHVHLVDAEDNAEATRELLSLAAGAWSVTFYSCTCSNLSISQHFLETIRCFYAEGAAAWKRLFVLPMVRGTPGPEEMGCFTRAAVRLVECLEQKTRRGELELYDFGRDGSAGFAFPRRYVSDPAVPEVVQGVLHVNTFVRVLQKVREAHPDGPKGKGKRSRQGRSLGEDGWNQRFFFAVKWAMVDRFFYLGQKVDVGKGKEGLRGAVDVESVLKVAAELLKLWSYPLVHSVPAVLVEYFEEYVAALDLGFYALLGHHRLLGTSRLVSLVVEAFHRIPSEHREAMPKTLEWLQVHSADEG